MKARFLVDEPLAGRATVALSGEELHHALRVVRVRRGEEIEVFNRAGEQFRASVRETDRDSVLVELHEPIPSRDAKRRVELAMAIIQLERFELVLQKATELGASSIRPLITDRLEVRPERWRGKFERWNRILLEAVKQSGRCAPPDLAEPSTLEEVLAVAGTKVVFDADEESSSAPIPATTPVILFIGPEGGWSERELAAARGAGCQFRRLGPRRLRAETAAVAALATVMREFGEM